MAKIIFSPLVADVAGKLGPVVFQRGPGGAMIRAAAAARPRMSARLQTARADLAEAARAWEALDLTTRTLWASIGRPYDPASAGPGLAFTLGRRAFIRYAVQYIHFGRTVPTSPTSWPFSEVSRAWLTWDPDSQGQFIWWYPIGRTAADFRIWLQAAPNYPQYSTRAPWLLAYDTATMPKNQVLPGSSPPVYYLEPAYFARFERYGTTVLWRMRVTGIHDTGTVFSFDDGLATLTFE